MARRAVKELFHPTEQLEHIRQIARERPDELIQKAFKIPEEKSGRALPFHWRHGQKEAYRIFKEERDSGRPVRLFFLKSRRIGLTSLFSSLAMLDAYSNPNRKVGIIAHNEFRSKDILAMCKFYYKNMPVKMQTPLARDAISGIKFADNDSEIIICTSAEPEKVRGGGLHFVEVSEPAHYGRNFRKVLLEISTTVAPEPETAIILETTGKGRGSSCHQFWEAGEKSQNMYRTVFLRWQDDPECVRPFSSELSKKTVLEEIAYIEPRLLEKCLFWKLSPEQIHWAYYDAYLHRCNGDYEYWCREFPMDAEEAWDSAGISFFGDNEIAAIQRTTMKPLMYQFKDRFINSLFKSFAELDRIGQKQYENNDGGLIIKQWAMPVAGEQYVVASDCSLGEAEGAFSAGYVINLRTREMMASFRGRIRPDEHAFILASLGFIYGQKSGCMGDAIVSPEINAAGGGLQILGELQRIGYFRIYIYRHREHKKGVLLSELLGWQTNSRTRPLMLHQLRKMFVDASRQRFRDPGMFRDDMLLHEMRTFQKDDMTGRIEAAEGSFDDTIMGLAICHQIAADETFGGINDIYSQYGANKDNAGPFSDLLRLMDEIDDGNDPCKVVDFLNNQNFDLREDGDIIWHPDY